MPINCTSTDLSGCESSLDAGNAQIPTYIAHYTLTYWIASLMGIVAIVSNTLIIVASFLGRKQPLIVTLIGLQAVTDVLFCAVCNPVFTSTLVNSHFGGGLAMCWFNGLAIHLAAFATVFSLVIITWTRRRMILQPQRPKPTWEMCRRLYIMSWIGSFMYALLPTPQLFLGEDSIFGGYVLQPAALVCYAEDERPTIFNCVTIILVVGPVTYLIDSYSRILYAMLGVARNVSMSRCKKSQMEQNRKLWRSAKMMIVVVILFCIGWGAALINFLWGIAGATPPPGFNVATAFCAIFNSFINPFASTSAILSTSSSTMSGSSMATTQSASTEHSSTNASA